MPAFSHAFRARWVDMDYNQHMRNAAYLGCAEETRMLFLEANGWTVADFKAAQVGPVVLEDRVLYKKELFLLEPFRVDLQVAAATEDFSRFKVRNRFFRESDGALAAVVDSSVVIFDLVARRPVPPSEKLLAVWQGAERSEDFEVWPTKSR
ncbi:MAG: acyl-CoA thioesterase [Myxococcota bacterium]